MLFKNIEAERARLGMTKADLAKHLGVSDKTLFNWMSGRNDIPVSKVLAMADIFHCTTDYLLGLDTGKPNT